MTHYQISKTGFTLVETLIVMTIIAVLFLVVIFALDPAYRFAEARNAKRWSHVSSLSNAMYTYIVDTKEFPPGLSSVEKQIGTATSDCDTTCPGAAKECLPITDDLKPYLEFMPIDPVDGTYERTQYAVRKNGDNIIVVRSCDPENGARILMAR